MIKYKDRVIVFDLEATCWDTPDREFQRKNAEIIEIGVCVLNMKTRTISNPQGILVKPVKHPISEFCTTLTTITQEMVDTQGLPLKSAIDKLKLEYDFENSIVASYGNYDRNKIISECKEKGIPLNFTETHLNVSHLSSLKFGTNDKLGLGKSLTKAGIKFEGTRHRGVDDAIMIAQLLSYIL